MSKEKVCQKGWSKVRELTGARSYRVKTFLPSDIGTITNFEQGVI